MKFSDIKINVVLNGYGLKQLQAVRAAIDLATDTLTDLEKHNCRECGGLLIERKGTPEHLLEDNRKSVVRVCRDCGNEGFMVIQGEEELNDPKELTLKIDKFTSDRTQDVQELAEELESFRRKSKGCHD